MQFLHSELSAFTFSIIHLCLHVMQKQGKLTMKQPSKLRSNEQPLRLTYYTFTIPYLCLHVMQKTRKAEREAVRQASEHRAVTSKAHDIGCSLTYLHETPLHGSRFYRELSAFTSTITYLFCMPCRGQGKLSEKLPGKLRSSEQLMPMPVTGAAAKEAGSADGARTAGGAAGCCPLWR